MPLSQPKSRLFLAILAAILLMTQSLFAQVGYTQTGTAVRLKTVALVDVDVYQIAHYMHQLPPLKSKAAVISMDTGKKFVLTLLRDVDQAQMKDDLKQALAMNGYSDAGKSGAFLGAFTGTLKKTSQVNIVYDADKKATTVTVSGGGKATVQGVDFMKAVWMIWFGIIDQPKLGDQLISKLQ